MAWGPLWASGAEGMLLSTAFADGLGGIVEVVNGVVAVQSIFFRLAFLRTKKRVIVRNKTVTTDATLAIITFLYPLVPEGTAVPVLAVPVLAEPILAVPVLEVPVLAVPVLAVPVLAVPVLAVPVLATLVVSGGTVVLPQLLMVLEL